VTDWAESTDEIIEGGYKEALASGLAALHALHVAAAVILGADELVTTEKSNKPIHRTQRLKLYRYGNEKQFGRQALVDAALKPSIQKTTGRRPVIIPDWLRFDR
jgi:hypothetical protein